MRIAVHDFVGHPFQFELSRELSARGHEVRHFFFADYPGPKGDSAPQPGDPAGFSVRPLSIDNGYSTEKMGTRLRGNLAYARVAAKAIADFRPDIVLSGNTPTEVQGQLIAATHRAGAKFVYWMQDFYSVAVSALLRTKFAGAGRLIGAAYRWADRRQLIRSDAIVLISEGFRATVAAITGDHTPIGVVPNWGAINDIDVGTKDNDWARNNDLAGRFAYLYSGTLGLKHDPMLLVALAKALAAEDPEAVVVVAAQGAGRTLLDRHLAAEPQANIRLLPLQPMADFGHMLAGADVMIALLEDDAGQFSVPSKVLSYLCAGRPIVLSAPAGNLSTMIVDEAQAGRTVPAGAPDAFVAAALSLRREPDLARELGANGRRYAEQTFRIDSIATRFEAIFETAKRANAA